MVFLIDANRYFIFGRFKILENNLMFLHRASNMLWQILRKNYSHVG